MESRNFNISNNGELVNNYFEEASDSEEEVDWSQRSDTSNEKLTEDHLVSAAVDYSNGHLPLVNRIMCLQEPNLQALDNIPIIHRPILHPLLALKIFYFKLIKYLGERSFISYLPIAKTDLQWISLIFLYIFISSDNTLYFIPLITYFVSLFVMIITTFQMLQNKRDFTDFRMWSGLFICYSGGSLNSEQAEYQYIKNNMKPYGHFFLALLLNLLVYPMIAGQSLPHSELSIISFCLTFMTLLGFMPKKRSKTIPDLLVLLSFAINVLAKYPYDTDPVVAQGWRFLDLKIPTFASYIIGNGIEFCINFRILLYVCIPVLFFRISNRENWRGTYKFLIPHCVTLSWLQIVIINSQGATVFGLLRGTLALVGIVLFLPLVGLTTIVLPAAALTKWLITNNLAYSMSTFFIISAVGLTVCWLMSRSQYRNYTALIQSLVCVISIFFLVNTISESTLTNDIYSHKQAEKSISWPQYHKFCYEPSWNGNVAQMQIKCSSFENVPVNWDGYVKEVRISSVKNTRKYIIDKFPLAVRNYLYCYYGDKIEHKCNESSDLSQNNCLYFYDIVTSNSKCTLEKYNQYEFNIIVTMRNSIWDQGQDIVVKASDYFRNFTLQLKFDDNIWFKGILLNSFSLDRKNSQREDLQTFVKLVEVGCVSCLENSLTKVTDSSEDGTSMSFGCILKEIYLCLKNVLNFLLNPLVVFN